MTADDWRYRGHPSDEESVETSEAREDEADLWEQLGLEPADDLPAPQVDTDAPTPPADSEQARPGADTTRRVLDRGKVMAILSHMSVLFGIPIFLIPLVMRKDALALHHAKAAAIIYFGFYSLLLLSMFSSSLFLPVTMLFYVPGIIGIGRAVQDRSAGLLGFGDLGERLFPFPKAR